MQKILPRPGFRVATYSRSKQIRGLYYSGQPNVSWCQFANAIFEYMDCKTIASPILTKEYPTPAIRPLNSRLDVRALKDIWDCRPFWRGRLEEILRDLEGEHDRGKGIILA